MILELLLDTSCQPGAGRATPTSPTNETTRYWLSVRGKDSSDAIGFNNRMDTEQNPTISVSFAQDVTDHEDVFIVNNWGEEVTEKNGEPSTSTKCAARTIP